MASIVRPLIMRKAECLLTTRRLLSVAASTPKRSSSTCLKLSTSRRSIVNVNAAATLQSRKRYAAAFHSSSRHQILPALPQRVDGTVNDPVPIHPPSPTHGSYHWTFERLISAGLVPLTIAPFAAGSLNPAMDALLCATLLVHSHIGFQAIIIDYLPAKRVPRIRALFWWGLRLATVVVGVGLYEFETNDVGLTEGIKRIWRA